MENEQTDRQTGRETGTYTHTHRERYRDTDVTDNTIHAWANAHRRGKRMTDNQTYYSCKW